MSEDKSGRELLAEVAAARARLMDESRAEAIAKLAKRGKLSARERIARLVDPGSLDEIGALVAAEAEDRPMPAGPGRRRRSAPCRSRARSTSPTARRCWPRPIRPAAAPS